LVSVCVAVAPTPDGVVALGGTSHEAVHINSRSQRKAAMTRIQQLISSRGQGDIGETRGTRMSRKVAKKMKRLQLQVARLKNSQHTVAEKTATDLRATLNQQKEKYFKDMKKSASPKQRLARVAATAAKTISDNELKVAKYKAINKVLETKAEYGVQLQRTVTQMSHKMIDAIKATHMLLGQTETDAKTIKDLKAKVASMDPTSPEASAAGASEEASAAGASDADADDEPTETADEASDADADESDADDEPTETADEAPDADADESDADDEPTETADDNKEAIDGDQVNKNKKNIEALQNAVVEHKESDGGNDGDQVKKTETADDNKEAIDGDQVNKNKKNIEALQNAVVERKESAGDKVKKSTKKVEDLKKVASMDPDAALAAVRASSDADDEPTETADDNKEAIDGVQVNKNKKNIEALQKAVADKGGDDGDQFKKTETADDNKEANDGSQVKKNKKNIAALQKAVADKGGDDKELGGAKDKTEHEDKDKDSSDEDALDRSLDALGINTDDLSEEDVTA